ncbi:MAG: GNAT family N-acetyltransferase [Planctomycetota bacterium]
MAVTYFKRYRMEYDLRQLGAAAPLPSGYQLVPWRDDLLETHAETKYRCFRHELDACVFPCLGEWDGCRRLMNEISRRHGFVPGATWLIQNTMREACGTIQGIIDLEGLGSIQNVGVVPQHRGRGLGTQLLQQALTGFRDVGLRYAFLEVTAQNVGAVRLYQRFGFRKVKTSYKASERPAVYV